MKVHSLVIDDVAVSSRKRTNASNSNSTFSTKHWSSDMTGRYRPCIALGINQRATDRKIKSVKFQETLPKVSSKDSPNFSSSKS